MNETYNVSVAYGNYQKSCDQANIDTFLTAAIGELRAEAGLLVVKPPPVISTAGTLGLGLQADRDLRLGETERLTVRLADKPVAVTQTSSVREGSGQG